MLVLPFRQLWCGCPTAGCAIAIPIYRNKLCGYENYVPSGLASHVSVIGSVPVPLGTRYGRTGTCYRLIYRVPDGTQILI
ncbi:MAG: hypothetical protein LBS80_02600, partial [Tannerella sp.]|nr:hypothetical protein [Tannerella sp.]